MLNVQVFRSGEALQLSASIGRVMLSGPVIARYSSVWRAWLLICTQENVAGSSSFCTCMAILNVPPACLGVRILRHERHRAFGEGRGRQSDERVSGGGGSAEQRGD